MTQVDEFRADSVNPAGEAPSSGASFDLPCFRCGVCCSIYQVRISAAEAKAIAWSMGMERWDWVGRYCDPRWHDTQSHLIRHENGGCVFLERTAENLSLCRIYDVRPASCRDWAAGVFKPACRDGLERFWGLGVDEDGRLRGSAEALSRFEAYLRSL